MGYGEPTASSKAPAEAASAAKAAPATKARAKRLAKAKAKTASVASAEGASSSKALAKAGHAALAKAAAATLAQAPPAAPPARAPWVKLRKTLARNPERTYITGTQDPVKKNLNLIVEVSKVRSSRHEEIADRIMESLKKDSITKEEALAMRQRLSEQYP